MRVVVGSKNPDKTAEVLAVLQRVLPGLEPIEGLDWPDVVETGATLEENAVLKARAVAGHTGHPAVADDTGLEVDALGGAPGVHTARYAGEDATYADNRQALLQAMKGTTDRAARFRTVVALVHPDGRMVTAEGVLEGEIAVAERGDGGFGYDPVFEVGGRTLAEIGEEEKNLMSHRARALEALAERLR
ncbi:MAG TPA: RdgB/HAM1 family non-canonical purine NTP pyrophosphatase [Acidimicrobiia bacterium]|nr:RdgB/HAM1 family non-canonical purine NTP pyrophosphatase [Acidimicrobiia bacterium]